MEQDNQRQAVLYAYLAGIFDGEGTIRIAKTVHTKNPTWKDSYHAHISIGMSDQKVMELIGETFGHSVGVRKERVPNRKLMYRWATSGTQTVPKILEKIYPYLIAKKEQARIVMEFCNSRKRIKQGIFLHPEEIQRREEFYWKVKKLNAVGAAATTNQEDIREDEVIV